MRAPARGAQFLANAVCIRRGVERRAEVPAHDPAHVLQLELHWCDQRALPERTRATAAEDTAAGAPADSRGKHRSQPVADAEMCSNAPTQSYSNASAQPAL